MEGRNKKQELQKATYLISVDTDGEKYNSSTSVSVILEIDYAEKEYKIQVPPIHMATTAKYPLWVAKAIEKAYKTAMFELYTLHGV